MKSGDRDGTTEAYLNISCNEKQPISTSIVRAENKVVNWDNKKYKCEVDDINNVSIKFDLYDKDFRNADDSMGSTTVKFNRDKPITQTEKKDSINLHKKIEGKKHDVGILKYSIKYKKSSNKI